MFCRKGSVITAALGIVIAGAALCCVGCEEEHNSGYYQYQREKTNDTGKDYDARYGVNPPAAGSPYTSPDNRRDVITPPSNLPPNNEPANALPPSQIPARQKP